MHCLEVHTSQAKLQRKAKTRLTEPTESRSLRDRDDAQEAWQQH